MRRIPGWDGVEIEVAESVGGVLAVVDAWDNLVRKGVAPWPPSELIQKAYQSRQARAFREAELAAATKSFGFYSDLQSIRSEDAITWSVFGPIAYSDASIRRAFVEAMLRTIDIDPGPLNSVAVWLWRRLPHPDSLVPGGPEIDFGIQSEDLFLLGEAKWLSGFGESQGVARDKNQVTLRQEFCAKYGKRLLPNCRRFVVLAVSPEGGMVENADAQADGVGLHLRDTTWNSICRVAEHPLSSDLLRYIEWKTTYSHSKNNDMNDQ